MSGWDGWNVIILTERNDYFFLCFQSDCFIIIIDIAYA